MKHAITLLIACLLVAPTVFADSKEERSARHPVETHLALDFGKTVLDESSRDLAHAFPYINAFRDAAPHKITPATIGTFLVKKPQDGGKTPAAIRTAEEARDAVRFFIAGPLVKDEATVERLFEAAKTLRNDCTELKPELFDYRPASYEPSAKALEQDRSMHPTEAWSVSLVAFEMDHILRLVHVKARVTAMGVVTIERVPIIDGPMTSWQSEMIMGDAKAAKEQEREEKAMRADALLARKRFAKALKAQRDTDTVWALSRIAHSFELFRQILGEPDKDAGSGIYIYHYALEGKSQVFIGYDGRRLRYVTHESIVATDERATKDGRGTEFRWEKRRRRFFNRG